MPKLQASDGIRHSCSGGMPCINPKAAEALSAKINRAHVPQDGSSFPAGLTGNGNAGGRRGDCRLCRLRPVRFGVFV
ncbi:hypothetical protein NEIPOLOT_01696 [Neisseria polysaccharea ATCC 43768]|nr:hypothetical protein NEIPOLOT_01696 [Neisseria polysaccharea ATCC 43768]